MESDFVRKNGLQWPPHKLQVATWVLFPLLVVHYFGFLRPLIWLPDSLGIFITILFTVMCVLAVVFGYITCAIDPADDSLLNEDGTHKTNNKNLSNMPASGSTQGDTTIYCYLCESNVDKSAKHCRYCQKCVTRFDHHCKWLNTCVGAKNYKYFLVSIFSVCVFTSITLGLSIGYTIEVFAFQDDIIKRLDDTGEEHAITVNFLKGLSIISAVIMLPLVALVYQLVGFHFMLIYQGITTYEFIVLEQKRQRDRMEAERSRKTAQKQAAAAAAATSPPKKDETTRVPSPSTLSSPSVPVLEGGSTDDVVQSDNLQAVENDKKAHNLSDDNHEGPIASNTTNKAGFEMVPLEESGEQ